jgi:hypothetical protein
LTIIDLANPVSAARSFAREERFARLAEEEVVGPEPVDHRRGPDPTISPGEGSRPFAGQHSNQISAQPPVLLVAVLGENAVAAARIQPASWRRTLGIRRPERSTSAAVLVVSVTAASGGRHRRRVEDGLSR